MTVTSFLSREVAQVDTSRFSRMGKFDEVFVLPKYYEPVFAQKTIPINSSDEEKDVQHCLYVSLDAEKCALDESFSLKAEILYMDDITGEELVEASYEVTLGILNFKQYFLLLVDDCEFFLPAGNGSLISVALNDLRNTPKLKLISP